MYVNQFSIDLKVHINNLAKSGNGLKPFQSSHMSKEQINNANSCLQE